jgi:hypothetical protein
MGTAFATSAAIHFQQIAAPDFSAVTPLQERKTK